MTVHRKELFPVDIYSVKKYGVEKWLEDFYWPVSDDEYLSLYRDVEEYFIKYMDKHEEKIRTLLSIQHKLPIEYVNLLHAIKVIQIVEAQGKEIMFSDKTWWYRNLLTGGALENHLPPVKIPKYNLVYNAKVKARKLLNTFLYNRDPRKWLRRFGQNEIIKVIGPVRQLMGRYIEKLPGYVHFTSEQDWFSKDTYKVPAQLTAELKKTSSEIADGLRVIADRYNIRLHSEHTEHLRNMTEMHLMDTAQIFYPLNDRLKGGGKMHVLMSGTAKPSQRALGFAIRQNGGKITTFIHGGDVGFLNFSPTLTTTMADNFVTYTSKSAELFKRIKETCSKSSKESVEIISGESDEYARLWENLSNRSLPSDNKKVMIIGYPYLQWRRASYAGGFPLISLDLELRLADCLTKAGHQVIYKAHPHFVNEISYIFKGKAQVLSGHIEDCWDKADTFLFPVIATTAFPVALCTNRRIVTLDLSFKLYEPFSDAMELFKKRCSIVVAKFDERNRILFDEKELLRVMAKVPCSPDTGFLKTYYFPDKAKQETETVS